MGCVKQTIFITSNPQGALVWVNDREVGRTPVEIDFLYYGEYDVRVELDGQEPIMTTRWAQTTELDLPVIDLVVGSVSDRESSVRWHFDLESRDDYPKPLIERARRVRNSAVGNNEE